MMMARTPEYPLARELARRSIMARVSAIGERFADADGVRAHQIDLQFANLIADDAHVAELAHAGGDGVGQLVARRRSRRPRRGRG